MYSFSELRSSDAASVADDGVNAKAYQTCGGHPYIGDTRNNSGMHCRHNNKAGVRYMFLGGVQRQARGVTATRSCLA